MKDFKKLSMYDESIKTTASDSTTHLLGLGSVGKRYFFQKDDENCYTLDYHLQYMAENHIKEMDLYLAKREIKSDYFFCKHFQECGERGECGKHCEAYSPRNGKGGVCKHFGYTYEQTERCFTIRIDEIRFHD
jgi:hypothetical protein